MGWEIILSSKAVFKYSKYSVIQNAEKRVKLDN